MTKQKTQVLIVASLAVVILAVGGFSLIPQGSPVSTKTATAGTAKGKSGTIKDAKASATHSAGEEKAKADLEKKALEDKSIKALVAGGDYSVRDPFWVDGSALKSAATPPPLADPKPATGHHTSGNSEGSDRRLPMPVDTIGGSLPAAGGSNQLPPIMQGKVAALPSDPSFKVKGVIVGPNPVAVFEDSSGGQKMVPIGGFVDGDTQVLSITRGRVVVKHRGKQKTLVIEEEAH